MELDLSAIFREDETITLAQLEVVWDGRERARHLLDVLRADEPAIDAIADRLRGEVPAQRLWGFGASGVFIRPDRHVRALYIQLSRVPGAQTAGGCIAIKGSEAICDNFSAMVQRLSGLWNLCTAFVGSSAKSVFMDGSMLNALERFPVVEGKPPGVHPVWDAIEEANVALEFQSAHLKRYGTLARAPVPLFVYRWPDQVGEAVLEHLRPSLSPKVSRIVESEVRQGLGVYVYYYPSLPLRVIHMQVPDVGAGATFKERWKRLNELTNPRAAINGWLEITARLLSLGYVATDPANLSRGYCLQAQNLAIDGGFVDVNSLRAMDSFASQGQLQFALSRTIQVLAQAITYFFIGSDARVPGFVLWSPDVFARVWSELRQRLTAELDAGHDLHPMLVRMCRPEEPSADLTRYFELFFDLAVYRPEAQESTEYRIE
jgi:hypothetical protein